MLHRYLRSIYVNIDIGGILQAVAIGINPLSIMLPAAVACSYAFMLPAATTSNTIVFESCNMKTIQMVCFAKLSKWNITFAWFLE